MVTVYLEEPGVKKNRLLLRNHFDAVLNPI